MTMRSMTRRCTYCRRVYTYNPSVGDLGFVCKYCGRYQLPLTLLKDYPGNGTETIKKTKKGSEILKKLPSPRKEVMRCQHIDLDAPINITLLREWDKSRRKNRENTVSGMPAERLST